MEKAIIVRTSKIGKIVLKSKDNFVEKKCTYRNTIANSNSGVNCPETPFSENIIHAILFLKCSSVVFA